MGRYGWRVVGLGTGVSAILSLGVGFSVTGCGVGLGASEGVFPGTGRELITVPNDCLSSHHYAF